jgi:hypothetical protein
MAERAARRRRRHGGMIDTSVPQCARLAYVRTAAEIRDRLASAQVQLAAMQKQYRDLTDTQTVHYRGIADDIIALEGSMARLRAFIRGLTWVLGTDELPSSQAAP